MFGGNFLCTPEYQIIFTAKGKDYQECGASPQHYVGGQPYLRGKTIRSVVLSPSITLVANLTSSGLLWVGGPTAHLCAVYADSVVQHRCVRWGYTAFDTSTLSYSTGPTPPPPPGPPAPPAPPGSTHYGDPSHGLVQYKRAYRSTTTTHNLLRGALMGWTNYADGGELRLTT